MADELVLEEAPVFEVITDGEVVRVQLIGCQIKEKPWESKVAPGEKDKRVEFTFKITESGDYFGRRIYGETFTTFNTSPSCRLRAWVLALFGVDDLPPGFRLNLEDLLDLEADVVVGVRDWKNADGTQGLRNFVKNVRKMGSDRATEEVF